MNIISIANELDESDSSVVEGLEIIDGVEDIVDPEETVDEDVVVDDLTFNYFDPKTGLDSFDPVEVEANDGTKMIYGYIKINDYSSSDEIINEIEHGLLDKIVSFVNQDSRVNISKENLITDRLYKGVVSFIVSSEKNSTKSFVVNKIEKSAKRSKIIDEECIGKICNSFFERFSFEDILDFDINQANQYLYDTLEKVAIGLKPVEKMEVKRRIKKELLKHDINLCCI